MDHSEVPFGLFAGVISALVRNGALSLDDLRAVAEGHDRMADEALLDDKKARAMQTADLARMLAIIAERPPQAPPQLRVVQNDEERRSDD